MVSRTTPLRVGKTTEGQLALRICRNLVKNSRTGIGDLKAICSRQINLDLEDEVLDFWNLLDIKCENILEELRSVQDILIGKE